MDEQHAAQPDWYQAQWSPDGLSWTFSPAMWSSTFPGWQNGPQEFGYTTERFYYRMRAGIGPPPTRRPGLPGRSRCSKRPAGIRPSSEFKPRSARTCSPASRFPGRTSMIYENTPIRSITRSSERVVIFLPGSTSAVAAARRLERVSSMRRLRRVPRMSIASRAHVTHQAPERGKSHRCRSEREPQCAGEPRQYHPVGRQPLLRHFAGRNLAA